VTTAARAEPPAEGLRLTVLGCDGSYPGPGGAGSGYLIEGGGTCLWLDAGPGTLANLQRHLPLRELDAVVVSHEHPDHCRDLEGLAVAVGMLERPDLPVYAPVGLRSTLYHNTAAVFDWREVSDGEGASVGPLRLRFSRTDHGPVTLAVRIDAGRRAIGYSADSGPGWSLEALGPGLDLALCEATYTRAFEGRFQHMSARQAGDSGRRAGAPRLVLTHRWPTIPARAVRDEGRRAFGGPVTLARTGSVYEIGASGEIS
jgi:ribonuclease BN (tRNA processing enzyme)